MRTQIRPLVLWLAILLGLAQVILPKQAFADSSANPLQVTKQVGDSFIFTLNSGFPGNNDYYGIIDRPLGLVTMAPVSPFSGSPFVAQSYGAWKVTCIKTGTALLSFECDGITNPDLSVGYNCVVTIVGPSTTAGNNPQSPKSGDPVSMATGELFGVESRDLSLGGPLPLYFERYYASRFSADGGIASSLGTNRTHNFDFTLVTDGTTQAKVTTSRGRVVYFSGNAGKWSTSAQQSIAYQLAQSGSSFRFADPLSQRQYVFDATGKLASIEDGRGNSLALTYNAGLLSSVSASLGRTLSFAYTSNLLSSVSDGTRVVSFTYSGTNLATATDANGNLTSYGYDSGFLINTTLPLGNSPISQAFTSGTVTSQTQRNAATSFVYLSGSTTETDPAGATQTYAYSPRGTLTMLTDAAGKSITMGMDEAGRWNSITDRLGATTTLGFHASSGQVASVTRPDGAVTSNAYTARKLANGLTFYDRTGVTNPDTTTQKFKYDLSGNLISRTDELGHQTLYTYNTRGQVLTMTNALGGVVTFTYDTAGRLASVHDSDTQAETFGYDSLSRLSTVTHADNTTQSFSYNALGSLTSWVDEMGGTATFVYDANNRLVSGTDALGASWSATYDDFDTPVSFTDRRGNTFSQTRDSRGLVVSATDALGNSSSYSYDARRRVTAITDPEGVATNYSYDDEARLTGFSDALGHTTRLTLDSLGMLIARTDALGHTTAFRHDLCLRPTTMTDSLGRQTKLAYDKAGKLAGASRDGLPSAAYTRDGMGNLTKAKDPNGGVWAYAYTPMGRLKSATDPLGRVTNYAYDARGRLSTVANPDGQTISISYDGANLITAMAGSDGSTRGFTYDADHRLMGATGSISSNNIAFTLDSEGNVTRSSQDGINWDATYDPNGRLASASYADGLLTVNYTYDGAGRLTSVSDTLTNSVVGFAYDGAGRRASMTRSNGVTTIYTRNEANHLTRLQHGSIIDLNYKLNVANEVEGCSMIAPLLPATQTAAKSFKLDKAAQIISASGSSGLPASGTYLYDAQGRLIASPGHAFGWNAFSWLNSIGDSASAANNRFYSYDALGSKVTRAAGPAGSPTSLTRYFHHHAIQSAPVVAEKDELAHALTRFYVYTPNGELLYGIEAADNSVRFYHADRNGNILALTDAGGNVTDSYAYGPYGESLARTGSSNQPFRWLGAWGIATDVLGEPTSEDPASLFYDVHQRWLDPATARFLSRDPAGIHLEDLRTLDPYQYAFGDPATMIDRTGRDPQADFEKMISDRAIYTDDYYRAHPNDPRFKYRGGYLGTGWVQTPESEFRIQTEIFHVYSHQFGAAVKLAGPRAENAIAEMLVGGYQPPGDTNDPFHNQTEIDSFVRDLYQLPGLPRTNSQNITVYATDPNAASNAAGTGGSTPASGAATGTGGAAGAAQ